MRAVLRCGPCTDHIAVVCPDRRVIRPDQGEFGELGLVAGVPGDRDRVRLGFEAAEELVDLGPIRGDGSLDRRDFPRYDRPMFLEPGLELLAS